MMIIAIIVDLPRDLLFYIIRTTFRLLVGSLIAVGLEASHVQNDEECRADSKFMLDTSLEIVGAQRKVWNNILQNCIIIQNNTL